MARTREFDEHVALERAMKLFWQKGYNDTSIRDLVEYTGVSHAGLYTAFKDKESLFFSAMERYNGDVADILLAGVESNDSGRAEIEDFFKNIVKMLRKGNFRDGCMIVNSALEFAHHTGEENTTVLEHSKRMKSAFEKAIKRSQKSGDVTTAKSAKEIASGLVSSFYGLATLSRAGLPVAFVNDSVKATISLMD